MLITIGIYAAFALFPPLLWLVAPFGIYITGMALEKFLVEPFLNIMQLNGQLWEIVSFLLCYVLLWIHIPFQGKVFEMVHDRRYVKKPFDDLILIPYVFALFSYVTYIAIAIQLWVMPWLLTSLDEPHSQVVFSTMSGLTKYIIFLLIGTVPFSLAISGCEKVSTWMKKRNLNSFDIKAIQYGIISIVVFCLAILWEFWQGNEFLFI